MNLNQLESMSPLAVAVAPASLGVVSSVAKNFQTSALLGLAGVSLPRPEWIALRAANSFVERAVVARTGALPRFGRRCATTALV